MIRKHFTDVPRTLITREGVAGVYVRFALVKEDGCPHYAMRIMEFEPGGHTSLHAHEEEHEFYFLDGEPAYVDCKGNETPLKPGDMIYVPSNEPHQLKNVGKTKMSVICTIPILPGGDGIKITKGSPVKCPS